jgi:hypothetical protein
MKYDENGSAYLELPDIIRVNQLVRGRIDFSGFKQWYDALSIPEQSALTTTLCGFVYQAGFDEETYSDALSEAGLDTSNPLVVHAKSFDKPYEFLNLFGLYTWLTQLDEAKRLTVFKMFVYLFGKAEGSCYQRETKKSCNHWWHRDLLDERVVQAILNDPHFYQTSMKDDDLIKGSDDEARTRTR